MLHWKERLYLYQIYSPGLEGGIQRIKTEVFEEVEYGMVEKGQVGVC